MYAHKGYHIGDAWYFVDDDANIVHMFYLTEPMSGDGTPFVGHAISEDLLDWKRLAPALETGPPGAWDDLRICTGSVIKRNARYWLAYAATGTHDSSPEEPWRFQRAGMAVSDDLISWQKLPENPMTQAGPPYYEEMSTGQRKMVHWRDPFLFDTGEVVYQFLCARRNEGELATRGTVAVTRSTDMRRWEVLAPLEHDRVSEEMEVPQVYLINGRWYLVFCTLGRLLGPEFAKRFAGGPPERINLCMVGDSPLGPFHIHGTGQIVQYPPNYHFYAAQLVNFKGAWYLLATIHDGASEWISDPLPVYADGSGLHANLSSNSSPQS